MQKRILLFFVLVTTLAGCQRKEEAPVRSGNYFIAETSERKLSNMYICFVRVGHEEKGCPGCAQIAGDLVHIPCHSHGSKCQLSSRMILQECGTTLIATTTDTFGLTSEDFFLMPNRSLDYTDENNNRVYLNFPEQLVYRDTATKQFTFAGLFITNVPEYSNN